MNDENKPLSKGFYALISLPATAMGFALSVQISALSWLLKTQLHLDIEQVGYVWAAGPLAGILGQVIIGFISDKVWFWNGRRRPFILIGGVLAALMLLALPNIPAIAGGLGIGLLATAITVALTLDLSINLGFNPTRSIIADVTPEGDARTLGFTIMQTVSGCLGVLAYGIGAVFGNYALIYVGTAIVFLFSFIPPFFIKEPRYLNDTIEVDLEGEVKIEAPSQTGELLKIYLAHAFAWLGIQTMFVYILAFIETKVHLPGVVSLAGNSDAVGTIISWTFLVMNLIGFLLPAFVLEPISKRIGRVRTHSLCMATMALGYLAVAFLATSPSILYLLFVVVGVGWAATVSLPFAIFSEKVDPAKMGTYMGIFNLSVVIPQLLTSLFFGRIINEAVDKSVVFYISAAALGLSSVLWLMVKESKSERRAKPGAIGGAH